VTEQKPGEQTDVSDETVQDRQVPARSKTREYVEAILLALVLALFIRTFVVQAFKIPSPSMVPTLLVGDHILVNKFLYGLKLPFSDNKVLKFKEPVNGDIVVFRMKDGRDFIKRVIGTPGDTISMDKGQLTVNGEKLEMDPVDEHKDQFDYYFSQELASEQNGKVSGALDLVETIVEHEHLLRMNPRYPSARTFKPVTIPADSYFVMGDNRDNSHDSRFWGFVEAKDIKGKAMIIYWSWDKSSKFPRLRRLGDKVK
jgi:signal peptidase I